MFLFVFCGEPAVKLFSRRTFQESHFSVSPILETHEVPNQCFYLCSVESQQLSFSAEGRSRNLISLFLPFLKHMKCPINVFICVLWSESLTNFPHLTTVCSKWRGKWPVFQRKRQTSGQQCNLEPSGYTIGTI